MSLRNKLTPYKTCITHVLTYACVAFAHTKLDPLQKVQNKFLLIASGCPWCVRKVDLHRDFELKTIHEHSKGLAKCYFERAGSNARSLVVKACD